MAGQTQVAVIGAGPYGLSVAAHLKGRGVKVRVFGAPMQTWREQMPRGMLLKSDGFASDLYAPGPGHALRDYCAARGLPYADTGLPVSLETFTAYGLWFQQTLVPELEPRIITHLDRTAAGFGLQTADGETVVADKVVVAAGVTHLARLPAELEGLPPELVSHSADHADPGALTGREVIVLGAGASAIDLAVLMHEHGVSVRLVARRRRLAFHARGREPRPFVARLRRPRSDLGLGWSSLAYSRLPHLFRHLPAQRRMAIVDTALGPSAGWPQRERFEGKAPALLGQRLLGASADRGRVSLRLAGPDGGETTLEADHVVAATGYAADVRRLPFLSADVLRGLRLTGQAPALDEGFESSEPGLHFVGLLAANTFGPVQRFACGARFASKQIAARL